MKIHTKLSIILFVMCILLEGCAILSEKQTGRITSDPAGANVYFYQADQKNAIGSTPCGAYIQYGLVDIYLVVEKSGYETEQVLVPRSGDISHHFVLERAYNLQIAEEKSNLKKEFIKEVAQILGTFDKALNSPRMLASSVVSQARSQIQGLILEYPEYSDSATVRALKRLLDKAEFVTSLNSAYYNTRTEVKGAIAVRELIDKIESGLGVAL